MKTVVGKTYKLSDLEMVKSLDPVSISEVSEIEKIMKRLYQNAEQIGLTLEEAEKLKNFMIQIKQRTISTQEGEQKDYEHIDLEQQQKGIEGPSDKTMSQGPGQTSTNLPGV